MVSGAMYNVACAVVPPRAMCAGAKCSSVLCED